MASTPPYLTQVLVDPTGLIPDADLPEPLPHGLRTRDFLRTVEDVQDLVQDLNSLLATKSYSRLEILLDPAGYSGLLSRTVADRLARASLGLVVNKHHNGYPDLIPAGTFPGDAIAKSDLGLEVKASRYDTSWQSHGPRAGWFTVVQFELDARDSVAPANREPTRVVAVMAARLEEDDWSWQPARAGRIRSGTATVKASGVAKLRNGAVWVRPQYRSTHDELTIRARMNALQPDLEAATRMALANRPGATAAQVALDIAVIAAIPAARVAARVATQLKRLAKTGSIQVSPGRPPTYRT